MTWEELLERVGKYGAVAARHIEVAGQESGTAAEILAYVCPEGQLPHRAALVVAGSLAVGALVLDGEHYALRFVVMLGAADAAGLEGALGYLVQVARGLRETYAPLRVEAATCFAAYAA